MTESHETTPVPQKTTTSEKIKPLSVIIPDSEAQYKEIMLRDPLDFYDFHLVDTKEMIVELQTNSGFIKLKLKDKSSDYDETKPYILLPKKEVVPPAHNNPKVTEEHSSEHTEQAGGEGHRPQ